MSHNGWKILALILIGTAITLFCASLPAVPPETPSARLQGAMRACERRVGIPAPSDPSYEDFQRRYFGAYVKCLISLGYAQP
jgi:hypothetical protein